MLTNDQTRVWPSRFEEVTDNGERVTHLYKNDCYFAHLSIYSFAVPLCRGKRVLDAGSGAGYGSCYLADNGATHVVGYELSQSAVHFSRQNFCRSNLEYRQGDLQSLRDFAPGSFDVVFTSNVLEHLPDVRAFLRAAWSILDGSGTLVVAVPPVVRREEWEENISNPYHLNIWTPRQWLSVVGRYFATVQPYRHGFSKAGATLDFSHTPEQCEVGEGDFSFEPVAPDDFYRRFSITVVLAATHPVAQDALPDDASPLAFVEDSFTRPRAPAEVQVEGAVARLGRRCRSGLVILRGQGVRALVRAISEFLRRRS